jgi:hypothetical protein
LSQGNNIERLVVRNAAGEAAPPYALAEISSAEDSGGESRLVIRKPTGSGQVVAVGPAGIAAGGIGYAFRGTPFVRVPAGSAGSVVYAQASSWVASGTGAGAPIGVIGDARTVGADTVARCFVTADTQPLAVAQLNGNLTGGASTGVIDNFRSLTGGSPSSAPTIATNTHSLSGDDNATVLLRYTGSVWVVSAILGGGGGSDDTKVVRIKSDTMSPTIGDEAIATATLSGIGKVYKAVLLSWSGSAWTEGTNIRVLVSPAKAGATPTANHNQVLLGQLVGTRTESSVDYALYGATEAAAGGGSGGMCMLIEPLAVATYNAGTETLTPSTADAVLSTGAYVFAGETVEVQWCDTQRAIPCGSSKGVICHYHKIGSAYVIIRPTAGEVTFSP